jgi:hypothetical protein
VQSIIKNELQYRKIAAQWVPKLLSNKQKNARVQICETLLARYRNEGDAFLHRIVTVDKTWCLHYTPELKRASKEWRGKDKECPVKAKNKSAGKVIVTFFFGIIKEFCISIFSTIKKPSMGPIIATFWRRFKQPIDKKDEVSSSDTYCCFMTMPGPILQP